MNLPTNARTTVLKSGIRAWNNVVVIQPVSTIVIIRKLFALGCPSVKIKKVVK